MTPETFQARTGVSHETLARMTAYHELLVRWQPKINLVGPATIPDAWLRHFYDSAQLKDKLPESTQTLVDLGSGAGFPGLVLAVLGVPDVHLVESDARKCAFLREAARVTGARITLHNQRIEKVSSVSADVITARALAPVKDLLDYGVRLLRPGGCFLLLKGRNVDHELTEATKYWRMTAERWTSDGDENPGPKSGSPNEQGNEQGVVLRLSAIAPVEQEHRA